MTSRNLKSPLLCRVEYGEELYSAHISTPYNVEQISKAPNSVKCRMSSRLRQRPQLFQKLSNSIRKRPFLYHLEYRAAFDGAQTFRYRMSSRILQRLLLYLLGCRAHLDCCTKYIVQQISKGPSTVPCRMSSINRQEFESSLYCTM